MAIPEQRESVGVSGWENIVCHVQLPLLAMSNCCGGDSIWDGPMIVGFVLFAIFLELVDKDLNFFSIVFLYLIVLEVFTAIKINLYTFFEG